MPSPSARLTVLCARVPAGRFKSLAHAFRFRDRTHAVTSARSLDLLRFHRTSTGTLRARAAGRDMRLELPQPGSLRVTIGFSDPTGSTRNQCAVMTAPLHAARLGGLRAP